MFMYRTLLFRKNKIRKGRGRNVCVWECGGVCELCEEGLLRSCCVGLGGGRWYLGYVSCVPTHQFFVCGGNDKGTCQRTKEA